MGQVVAIVFSNAVHKGDGVVLTHADIVKRHTGQLTCRGCAVGDPSIPLSLAICYY